MNPSKLFKLSILLIAFASTSVFAVKDYDKNKKLAENFQHEVYVNHNVDSAANKYLSKDFVAHSNGRVLSRDEWVNSQKTLLKEYPNLKSTIINILSDGDFVVTHIEAKRTPNSDNREFIIIKKVSNDGLFTESWIAINEKK